MTGHTIAKSADPKLSRYLTSSDLFNLVKAKKKSTSTGERGGRYYINSVGNKVYPGEKAVPARLLFVRDKAPHSGTSQEKIDAPTAAPITEAISRRREAETVQVGRKPRKVPQDLRFTINTKNQKHIVSRREQSAAHAAQTSSDWPSFLCRSCKSPVRPLHNQPIFLSSVDPQEAARRAEAYAAVSEEDQKDLPNPDPVVGRQTMAVVKDISTGKTTMLSASPELVDAAARKVCPKCYAKYELESRELKGATEIKRTRSGISASSRKKKSDKREAKLIEQAQSKDRGKRSPEQQAALDRYEAEELGRQRTTKDQHLEEKRRSPITRRRREAATFKREEKQSRSKAQMIFTKLAMDRGVPKDKAEESADKLSHEEVLDILYRHEQYRAIVREKRIADAAKKEKQEFKEAMDRIAKQRKEEQGIKKSLWVSIRRSA